MTQRQDLVPRGRHDRKVHSSYYGNFLLCWVAGLGHFIVFTALRRLLSPLAPLGLPLSLNACG